MIRIIFTVCQIANQQVCETHFIYPAAIDVNELTCMAQAQAEIVRTFPVSSGWRIVRYGCDRA